MSSRFFLIASLIVFANSLFAALELPALFSDHMVLQAGRETNFWGKADPGVEVRVEFLGQDGSQKSTASAKAGADGGWALQLPKLDAGTRGNVKISVGGEPVEIKDVLVGEVWLGSGQSNMQFVVGAPNVPPDMLEGARREADEARDEIRFFRVVSGGADEPAPDVQGTWEVIGPDNVKSCSATAWYFAQALRERLKTPVGMIVSAVGGTPVEAWMPKSALTTQSSVSTEGGAVLRHAQGRARTTVQWKDSWTDSVLPSGNSLVPGGDELRGLLPVRGADSVPRPVIARSLGFRTAVSLRGAGGLQKAAE